MVECTKQSGIATIRLNRVEKRNALDQTMVRELANNFTDCNSDPAVRVIVLTGTEKIFSAGADLEALNKLQNATFDENLFDSTALASLFEMIWTCPKPVIGAINGHAIAGGCGLATLCDITVSVDSAKFGYTETRIGFVPAMVAWFLHIKIGDTQTRRLLLSGELIDATEAQQIGLITEVTSVENFPARIDHWAELFAKKVSPAALSQTKDLLRNTPASPWKEALQSATLINARARGTDDCKKGVKAFLNKQTPDW